MTSGSAAHVSATTPCLLFPELLEFGGGLARAVTERASLYSRHHDQVRILTTGFSPGQDAVVAELQRRGALDERVVVRNFFQHSTWVAGLGRPPRSGPAHAVDGAVTWRQRLPGGPFIRLADRREPDPRPYGYRYFDRDGQLLATTRTANGRKHETEVDFHDDPSAPSDWGAVVARWVDEELADLPRPVLFSLQRGLSDPVLLAARRPVRKVVSLHNCHYNDPEDRRSGVRRGFQPVLEPAGGVDEVICLTEEQRRELVHDAPGRVIRAIPYPGRPPLGDAPATEPDLVVMVGQLIERKRVDHTIRAFAAVVAARPAARLEVYGEGPAQAALEALIEQLGLQRSVRLMGYSLEVGAAQSRASCTLMTSTFEGYARVIAESLARGTPVVAYDVRYGPRDLIRHGVDGLLVDVHEPGALAEAVLSLLADPAAAAAMGAHGREILERLPLEEFEQAWLDVVTGANAPPRWSPAALASYPVHRVRDRLRRSRLARGVWRRVVRRPRTSHPLTG